MAGQAFIISSHVTPARRVIANSPHRAVSVLSPPGAPVLAGLPRGAAGILLQGVDGDVVGRLLREHVVASPVKP